jgi:5-methylcytosine-specific restriction endonuclease McrA
MTTIPRACITCGRNAVPGQSRCANHMPKSPWNRYKLTHPEQTEFYHSGAWRDRRYEVLKRDPECQLKLDGCTRKSQEVDHIIRPADGGSHEIANLRGVCKVCHRKRTLKQSNEGKRRAALARRRRNSG